MLDTVQLTLLLAAPPWRGEVPRCGTITAVPLLSALRCMLIPPEIRFRLFVPTFRDSPSPSTSTSTSTTSATAFCPLPSALCLLISDFRPPFPARPTLFISNRSAIKIGQGVRQVKSRLPVYREHQAQSHACLHYPFCRGNDVHRDTAPTIAHRALAGQFGVDSGDEVTYI